MTTIKRNFFWDNLKRPEDFVNDMAEELREPGQLIVNAVTSHPEGITEKQIRQKCHGATTLLHRALRQLLADEVLSRKGGGVRGNPYLYVVKPDE